MEATEDMRFKIQIELVYPKWTMRIYDVSGDVKDLDKALVEAARFLIKCFGLDAVEILKTAQEVKP